MKLNFAKIKPGFKNDHVERQSWPSKFRINKLQDWPGSR